MRSARLDETDWRILRELQANGRITNVELARKVGISAPPCLRRVRALEEAGFIRGYAALLDDRALGFDVTARRAAAVERTMPVRHRCCIAGGARRSCRPGS